MNGAYLIIQDSIRIWHRHGICHTFWCLQKLYVITFRLKDTPIWILALPTELIYNIIQVSWVLVSTRDVNWLKDVMNIQSDRNRDLSKGRLKFLEEPKKDELQLCTI